MTQSIKSIIVSLLLVVGLLSPLAFTGVVYGSTIQDGLGAGAELTDPDSDVDAQDAVEGIVETVINVFSLVVGIISVIMIIIGGLKYITSGGDSGNVTGAKNTILYAIIGLVIVALAQIIVRFVIDRVAGA